MQTYKAFDTMLRHCGIRAKDLAAISSVSESRISQFRNGLFLTGKGSDITSKALDDLLEAAQKINPEARFIYSSLQCDRMREYRFTQKTAQKSTWRRLSSEQNWSFQNILGQTLRDCKISYEWLAEQSGLSQRSIAEFCEGKPSLQIDDLEKALCALPHEAQWYFFGSILGTSLDIEKIVLNMSTEQIARMLFAMAQRIGEHCQRLGDANIEGDAPPSVDSVDCEREFPQVALF